MCMWSSSPHPLLVQVFALIRYPEDPQRFSIEYSNGVIRKYSSTERYTVLVYMYMYVHVLLLYYILAINMYTLCRQSYIHVYIYM